MQAWSRHALLIMDEGKNVRQTRLLRRMAVYNYIPSRYGVWFDTGTRSKNFPIERVIEDPWFKDSRESYFIQLADFCAYALLRRENQLPSKNKYGIHEAFALLEPVLFRDATRYDPDGIIRDTR